MQIKKKNLEKDSQIKKLQNWNIKKELQFKKYAL